MSKRITLELSESQAYTIMEAVEFFGRIGMGQLQEIVHQRRIKSYGSENANLASDYQYAEKTLACVKKMIYGLEENSFYGIASERIHHSYRTAWDIYQTIRHATSWYNNPVGGWTCNFDKPDHLDKKDELPKITITE